MQTYEIINYQKGFEHDQARIGTEVARNWIWPYAYSLEDLIRMHARSRTGGRIVDRKSN
jgi:hypothetical protein